MTTLEKINEQSLALFLLGLLLFNPPLLWLFSVDGFVFGVPILYVYIFLAWVAFIALMAIRARHAETIHASRAESQSASPPETGQDA